MWTVVMQKEMEKKRKIKKIMMMNTLIRRR